MVDFEQDYLVLHQWSHDLSLGSLKIDPEVRTEVQEWENEMYQKRKGKVQNKGVFIEGNDLRLQRWAQTWTPEEGEWSISNKRR